ncbi:sulfite exporter TauE/SafE family protein [Caldimonas sp. KR1-144]|uniref:sulfite exporter TauE/SafE family protein n=1 Tax=Caldimonas sp. KR1-144 TaxID=3400911 RepID=UPI003BFB4D65
MDRRAAAAHDACMENISLSFVAFVFALAGAVKGVTGLGLPTLSMALLGWSMAPAQAAALMLLPSLLTNLAQCVGPHARVLARRLWPLWLAMGIVAAFAPVPGLGASRSFAAGLLGAVLAAYGLWGLVKPALPRPGRRERWIAAGAGALSGLLTAATGVFVMPLVPFLQSMKLERDALVQALGLSFTLASLALAVRLEGLGSGLATEAWPLHAVAVAAAFAGLGAGASLRGLLRAATFQRALYAVFVMLGLALLAKAL